MPQPMANGASRPRIRGRLACAALLAIAAGMGAAAATPYVPGNDDEVLGRLPAGATHTSAPIRRQAEVRLDVALPLAQFYISQARATGDLRFLGYAEAVLSRWRSQSPPDPAVLVLQATILQSRHAFEAALAELDAALRARPDDAQAWLTRATVLRVLGRYPEAGSACVQFARWGDAGVSLICEQSIQGLTGHLESAYATLARYRPRACWMRNGRGVGPSWARWRYASGTTPMPNAGFGMPWLAPQMTFTCGLPWRTYCYASIVRRGALLLQGQESIEPLLLRMAIAQKQQLQIPALARKPAEL